MAHPAQGNKPGNHFLSIPSEAAAAWRTALRHTRPAGSGRRKLRLKLSQRVRQNIHAPALLGSNPRFQPQAGGIVHVPADYQRIFSGFVLRRGKADGNIVDQHPVEHAEQRLQGRLLALQASTERNEKMGDQRLRRIIATLLFLSIRAGAAGCLPAGAAAGFPAVRARGAACPGRRGSAETSLCRPAPRCRSSS